MKCEVFIVHLQGRSKVFRYITINGERDHFNAVNHFKPNEIDMHFVDYRAQRIYYSFTRPDKKASLHNNIGGNTVYSIF